MQHSSELNEVKFSVGTKELLSPIEKSLILETCSKTVLDFLHRISNELISNRANREHANIVALSFWLASLKDNELVLHYTKMSNLRGRGLAFHITPANVPLNFAYSLFVSLLAGNANVVRLPSKSSLENSICISAIEKILSEEKYSSLRKKICLIQYPKNSKITDYLSSICDVRIIWGGNETIQTIRRSALKPNATEITFPNRYSIAVLNVEEIEVKLNEEDLYRRFYNDTLISDQNACSSPMVVIWVGRDKRVIRDFWNRFAKYTMNRYQILASEIQYKFELLCNLAMNDICADLEIYEEGNIWTVSLYEIEQDLSMYHGRSGFFYQIQVEELEKAQEAINIHVQTVSHFGFSSELLHKVFGESKIKGGDRFIPLGRTLEFSLIWDGQDLIRAMSRARVFEL
jgi:hypothetical protein